MAGRLDLSLTPGGGLRCLQGRDAQWPVARCWGSPGALGSAQASHDGKSLARNRRGCWCGHASSRSDTPCGRARPRATSVTLVPTPPTSCAREQGDSTAVTRDANGQQQTLGTVPERQAFEGTRTLAHPTHPSRLASRRLAMHCPRLTLGGSA